MHPFIIPLQNRIRITSGLSRQPEAKIPLIKAYRECTGMGLKDSKEAVERAYGTNCIMTQAAFIYLFGLDEKSEPIPTLSPLQIAIGHIEKHWKILGFESLHAAINSIAGNFD